MYSLTVVISTRFNDLMTRLSAQRWAIPLLFTLSLLLSWQIGDAPISAQSAARKLNAPTTTPIIAILPSPKYAIDHTLYILSESELFRSTDDGETWSAVERWPDSQNRKPTFVTGTITPFVDAVDGYSLLVATATGKLWKLNPTALAWKPLDSPLSPTGPWLLTTNEEGAWLLNPNGTGLVKITNDTVLQVKVSPAASHIAYITDTEPDAYFQGLTLRIISLADLTELLSIPLQLPDVTEDDPAELVEVARQATISLSLDSFKWSPDGTRLAFVGGQGEDALSTDLYLYTLETGEISRLTSGPSQAYQLHWSPDSQWIFHAGVSSFGTGAGYLPSGLWLARGDGSFITEAYPLPENSSAETLVAWLDGETMLVHSWILSCGNINLRIVNLVTGESQLLWPGAFQDMAYDAQRKQLWLSASADNACNPDANSGLFTWQYSGAERNELQPLTANSYERIYIDEGSSSGLLYQRGAGLSTVDLFGTVVPVSQQRTDYPSQLFLANNHWVWAESSGRETGLWIESTTEGAHPIFSAPVKDIYWSLDGQNLLFLSEFEGLLYQAQAPDFVPTPLLNDVEATQLFWLPPATQALNPAKIMAGEFTAERALAFLYGEENLLFDNNQMPYVQLQGNREVTTVYINGLHAFQEGEVERYFLLTETVPAEEREAFICRACQPTIGGAVFSQTERGWYLNDFRTTINQLGQMGVAPESELLQIGPDTYAARFPDGRTGQGYLFVTEKLVAEVDGQLAQIFQIQTFESNGGSLDCGEGNCYEFSAEIEFVRGAHPTYDDIVVTTQGTREVNRQIEPIHEVSTYTFSGSEYLLVSTRRLVR